MKSKPISTNPAFPSYVAKQLARPFEHPDASSANVTARLLNANPVKAVIADILASIYKELGIPSDERPRKKKRLRAADFKGQSLSNSQKPPSDLSETPKAVQIEDTDDQVLDNQSSTSDELGQQGTTKSEDESIDYDAYESRLADSEEESDSLDEGGVKVAQSNTPSHDESPQETQYTIPTYDPSHSLSHSSSVPSQSPPPPSSRSISKPAKATPLPKAPTKQTTFLPSLIGGYFSGSDSAPEEDETAVALLKPRKNRRGQQERRAIWEKKFGSRAKHIQQQQQQTQGRPGDRDAGWDARRGASEAGGRRGQGRGRVGIERDNRAKRTNRGSIISSGANSDPLGERRGARKQRGRTEAPLHPSWEAKKKAKEKAGSKAVAFQGKKVVFD